MASERRIAEWSEWTAKTNTINEQKINENKRDQTQ